MSKSVTKRHEATICRVGSRPRALAGKHRDQIAGMEAQAVRQRVAGLVGLFIGQLDHNGPAAWLYNGYADGEGLAAARALTYVPSRPARDVARILIELADLAKDFAFAEEHTPPAALDRELEKLSRRMNRRFARLWTVWDAFVKDVAVFVEPRKRTARAAKRRNVQRP